MKKCFLIIAILALATCAFAQHDEQVTIEGTYRPKVNKVNKLSLKPDAPTSTISFPDTEAQPMETGRKFDLDLDKINPLTLSSKISADVTPTQNFLMAGMGTRLSPLFLYKHNSMLTKNTGIGVGVKHFSSWLNIKDYAPSGFMNNAFDVSVTTKEFDNLQLGGKVYYKNDVCHYYGVNLSETPLSDAEIETFCPRQAYNAIGAKFDMQTTSTRLGEFAHRADFDYHYFFDKVYGQSEHSAALNYGISYSDNWWGSKENPQKLGVDVTAHYDYLMAFNRLFTKLNPYFEMKGDFYRLRAGFKMFATFSDYDDKQFLICPDLKGSLFVFDKKLEFYANLGGGQKLLTYSEITEENPFVARWLPLYNQCVNLDFKGGVRSNILQTVDLHLGVRYRHADEDMFYGTLTENVYSEGRVVMLNNRFVPIFDETNTVSVLGDMRWLILDNLTADLNLAYNHCTPSNLAHPLYRPAFEGKLKVKYGFDEKLAFNASVFYQNGRYGMDDCSVSVLNLYDFNSVVKLKDVIDIAFGADYKINDQMAVFAKIDNLANCKYQLFYNYPVTGIQLFAGLKMTF